MTARTYLDWNATAPLCEDARIAMVSAMDVVGNPSSVHAEGRAAKSVTERARAQVADLVGCEPSRIVFTSGATEAAAIGLRGRGVHCADIEHDCVAAHCVADLPSPDGIVEKTPDIPCAVQGANSETGILQDARGVFLSDQVQVAGKMPMDLTALGCDLALVSAHKFGGPKGVGALILRDGVDLPADPVGGQELGRRSGTENVIGIAGFGAAAQAAQANLSRGTYEEIANLRDRLESILLNEAPRIIIFGRNAPRLPNTTAFAIPGWKGETQVMQMDLAGYAISAGSACSSGKVRSGRVLKAMGYDDTVAGSAIRVSLGPVTTEQEITGFARSWLENYHRFKARMAQAAE